MVDELAQSTEVRDLKGINEQNHTYLEFHLIGNAIGELLQSYSTLLLIQERILDGVFFEIDTIIQGLWNITHLFLELLIVIAHSKSSSTFVKFISA